MGVPKNFKKFVEGRILYLATADENGKPNLVCVEGNKLVGKTIVFTNNAFNKTQRNLKQNKKVSLVLTNGKKYFQAKGIAKLYSKGNWFDLVKSLPVNKGLYPKAAVLVEIRELFDLDSGKKLF